jgi:DNA-binding phage protein
MKTQKEDMEKYIISYLETINEEYVNIDGTAKLTKTISKSKGAINYDNIKLSVVDSLKKQNINEEKINGVLGDVLETIEKNRPVKTRTYIKRTKGAANKKLRDIADDAKKSKNKKQINNDDDDVDDDIPQYNSK